MLGAIRRVISGDALDNSNNEDAAAAQQPTTESPNNTNHNNSSSPHPIIQTAVVVEHDNNDNDNCTTSSSLSDASANNNDRAAVHHHHGEHEHSHQQHHEFFNDDDDHHHHPVADVYMDDAYDDASPTPLAGHHQQQQQQSNIPPAHYQQHLEHRIMAMTTSPSNNNNNTTVSPARRMQRMNSSSSEDGGGGAATTASQNSSRDWGWFEEWGVSGGSEGGGRGGERRTGSGGGSHRNGRGDDDQPMYRMVVGLDPRDDTEASAMAVTAPTYVLEESRSSQRLWKDSAGRRPPQPVEERAFYEQMWAQNFAKSQVNYYMPSEVLTATTPISLSPFAEGGTMEMSPEAAASDGNNNFQYNMNIHAPADTHNMMVMPSSVGGGNGGAGGGGSNDNYSCDDADAEGSGLGSGGGLKETPRATAPNILPPTQHQHIINKTAKSESGEEMCVLVRGDNVFGTTVSKSFALSNEKGGAISNVVTVNISIASYRVVESRKRGKYAQFLVIYREGSIRDTIGVWKRYSDFDDLARTVTQAHEGCASVIANMSPLAITEEHEVEHLPNAITSWRLLKKRQRWYRCLDSGYLSLKVFLLERFLHDILFESSSPQLLREFVGGPEDD